MELIIKYLVCQFLIAYQSNEYFGRDRKLMDCICSKKRLGCARST